MNAAREKVRVARALADLPKISSAFEHGRLSFSKVRAMTRVADADNEDYLMMIATHGTAHHVEKLVAKYRTAKRLQANDDTQHGNESNGDRELTHYYDSDGYLVLRARLPADQGALVVQALEKAMDDVTAETSYLEDGPGVTAETSRRIDGDTSLDNLVLLCRQHHRLVHEGGFRCERTTSGEFVFRDRRDEDLPTSIPLPGLNPDALQTWLDRDFFEAGDDTEYGPCAAKWYAGDRMDWQMAVSAMFPR